jgi:hypothetical protein
MQSSCVQAQVQPPPVHRELRIEHLLDLHLKLRLLFDDIFQGIDVREHDGYLCIHGQVRSPGRRVLAVHVVAGLLMIDGSQPDEAPGHGHFEFRRSVKLPVDAFAGDAHATIEAGVLEVRVPLWRRGEHARG